MKTIVSLTCKVFFLVVLTNGCGFLKSTVDKTPGTQNSVTVESQKNENSAIVKTGSTLCQNAYNPIAADLERKYRVTTNGLPAHEMTETYRDITADSFVVHSDFAGAKDSDVKTDIKWLCTAEGLTPNDFDGNTMQTKNGVSGKFETLKVTGVSLPAEARWKTGEKWNAKYDVKYTMQFPNSQMRGEGDGTVDGAGEILGEETVTVPAGTFQALKVRTVTKMNITVKVGGTSMPNQFSLETLTWFAKDIGKVKSVNTLGGTNVGSTELLSINNR
ncbi:MAG TPA: hypothetical protein VGC76_01750 [Pyrinomonadaceae bacterium]|jgi:hypothetical protein